MPGALEVVVAGADVDLASGLLWGAGVTAVAEHPEADGRVRLRVDVPPGGRPAVDDALGGRWAVVEVEVVDDGLDAWREHAVAVPVGDRLLVRPPWVDAEAGDRIELVIDPGRAFGHGAHPTTVVCLEAVARLVGPGAAVADVGCGSGVVAVAAARLGAASVVAVDIEPAAVAATDDNARRNGVADVVTTALAADPGAPLAGTDPGSFDVVVANIGAAMLVGLAGHLLAAARGPLVLSGTLDPPPPEVVAAYGGADAVTVLARDGWTALVVAPPD